MQATLRRATGLALLLLVTASSALGASNTSVGEIALRTDLVIGDAEDEMVGLITAATEDSKGNIYLADVGFQYVQKYDAAGKYVSSFGTIGEGPGTLMFPFVMAIDHKDRLYFAGVTGRVSIWDTEGKFQREFRRLHPDGTVRSIRVGRDGKIYLAVTDILEQTTIDSYDSSGKHLVSFGQSFAVGKDVDTRVEGFYAGGYLDISDQGNVAYTQQAPYLIELFDSDGMSLKKTSAGGADFVPFPSLPDANQASYSVSMESLSLEITSLSGDRWLNCAHRYEGGDAETLLTLYDKDLNLIARSTVPKALTVVGVDSRDRLFIFTNEGDAPLLSRASIEVLSTPDSR